MEQILARHKRAVSALPVASSIIGGREFRTGDEGVIQHINPTTGKAQSEVPLAGPREVDLAVAAADAAFQKWRLLPPAMRRNLILKLNELLQDEGDRLGTIAALENGTTKASFVSNQMPFIGEWLTYYAGWADKVDGTLAGGGSAGTIDMVVPDPFGVVAIIIPWNGPLGSLGMKAAAALAAGNTLVIKPPELAPFLAVRFAELAREAGFPDGVINVVIGGAVAGEALVSHPGVAKISFTGSPQTAIAIAARAAGRLTPLIFELGGKSANIVFSDAPDLDQTAAFAAAYPFMLAGQFCVCPSRLLIQDEIYDLFLEKTVAIAKTLSVGDPLSEETAIGPLINDKSMERVLGLVERASRGGARLVNGGARLGGDLAKGYFLGPTIFADVRPDSEISQTEVFGPVLTIHRFKDEAEAVTVANGTEYGLAAYVHTANIDRALGVARKLHSGGVFVNRSFPTSNPNVPFGGVGLSGFGREGGRAGLEEFFRPKAISIALSGS
jgi:aldehyde dehydrogenase (NAD+)